MLSTQSKTSKFHAKPRAPASLSLSGLGLNLKKEHAAQEKIMTCGLQASVDWPCLWKMKVGTTAESSGQKVFPE